MKTNYKTTVRQGNVSFWDVASRTRRTLPAWRLVAYGATILATLSESDRVRIQRAAEQHPAPAED